MTATLAPIQTRFVPAQINCTDWSQIEPLARALLDRPVTSAADLETWLIDRGELEAAIAEAGTVLYINMTCDTENVEVQQAYARFVEEISPKYKPLAFELDRKQAELSDKLALPAKPGDRFHVLTRAVKVEAELFRPDNVPLQTELALLSQRYDQIAGAMTVKFEGEEKTLPQMARYQELTDRATRESAWRAVADRRLADRENFDDIYDQMVRLRHKVATNAGFADYSKYVFREKHRFDYTERHCRDFHDACEQVVVPFVRKLNAERRQILGIPSVRPWDLAVDVRGRQPLRPFTDGVDLQNKAVDILGKLDPRLGQMLRALGDGSNTRGVTTGESLDLDTRRGKAPGGYQSMLDRRRVPFIFMNAAGLNSDFVTMLHEAGHAFHSILAKDEPLLAYRSAPIEFCEVASMSMELLALPHMASVYSSPTDLARALRQQFVRSITILPWIAQIDAFQFWVYANPNHTRDERTNAWLALDDRFGGGVDWSGFEASRASLWHRQLHLFGHPFYYIEYAIAQLGALQLWLISVEQGPRKAVDLYCNAMALGGTKPLPELFNAAGLSFDFGPATVKRLVDRVETEIAKYPE